MHFLRKLALLLALTPLSLLAQPTTPDTESQECENCDMMGHEFSRGPGPPPAAVPVDGGILVLLTAGTVLGLGARRLYSKNSE